MITSDNMELKSRFDNALKTIRNIVGNKRFTFSDAYIKQCKYEFPTLGKEGRTYSVVTKKYVYIPCRVIYEYNEDETELGAFLLRYSVLKNFDGEIVTKVKLEDLFLEDLEKLKNDLTFYLWWEKNVRFPKIKSELEECEKYVKIFEKIN